MATRTIELTSERLEFDDPLQAIEDFYRRGWTDGLPVIPPTEGRVREFLDFAGRAPDEIVGVVAERRRMITVEKAAINAVMAGCLPAYFPVVLAAVEAMADPTFNLHGSQASTGGSAPLAIVNGPLARELGLNAGGNVFGPGNRGNATIGRALRLILMNVCGNQPGLIDRSTIGHPGKYSYCIAELEDAPWRPLHVERGLTADTSAVTLFAGEGPHCVANHVSNTPEGILTTIADEMSALGSFTTGSWVVVICPEHRQYFWQAGWSKADIRQWLFEHVGRTKREVEAGGKLRGPLGKIAGADSDDSLIKPVKAADDILVVAAGGGAGAFSAVIPPWAGGMISRPVTKGVGVCIDC